MTDETIANVPILILGNKIDRPEAISEERLRETFGLYGQTTGKVILFFFPLLGKKLKEVFPCVVFIYLCWFQSTSAAQNKTFFVYYILSTL